jgi:O-antigen ligase
MSSAGFIDARRVGRTRRALLPFGAGPAEALGQPLVPVVVVAAAVSFLPLLRPGGPANTAPVDLLITLALATSFFWATSSGQSWRLPYALPMVLFVAGGALGALNGPVPGAGITALIQDFSLLAWCWVVANMCKSAQTLGILLKVWAYSSIVSAGLLLIGVATGTSALSGQTAKEASRTMLTFGNPNVAANYFFISIMIIWACHFPRARLYRVGAYGLLIAALLTTGSNSGLVSLIVGATLAALVAVYRRAGIVPAATTLAFVLVGVYFVASNLNLKSIQASAQTSQYAFIRDGIGRQESSVAARSSILGESIRLYRTGGPLGAGPASTKPRLQADEAPVVKEAHNDYLAALTERGVVGSLGLVLLLACIALRALSPVTRTPTRRFASVVVKPNALLGAIAGTAVAMGVDELLHQRHVWTLFAFVAAVSLWGREWRGPEFS